MAEWLDVCGFIDLHTTIVASMPTMFGYKWKPQNIGINLRLWVSIFVAIDIAIGID